MNECSRFRPLLALSAGHELGDNDAGQVRSHLENCPSCRAEEGQYRALIALGRDSHFPDHQLSPMVLRRIAVEAAERASKGAWWDRLAPLPLSYLSRRFAVLTTAAVLVVLATFPLARRNWMPPGEGERVQVLEVVARDGAVRLAWSDGDRETYTVIKSTDPRMKGAVEAHQVIGNVWIDTNPESSPVVFYRID